MKSASPVLLPLLRSRAQGDIITWIVLHPDRSASLTQIAEATGLSLPTVKREVDRLADAGLIVETRRGNTRLIQAATDNVVYGPLSHLMAVTFGPLPVLQELLADVEGVQEAYIYGSWAARYAGKPGPIPGDIDVLVIGLADPDVLDDIAAHASSDLDREVNIRRVRPASWEAAEGDPFKATILSRPLISLINTEERT